MLHCTQLKNHHFSTVTCAVQLFVGAQWRMPQWGGCCPLLHTMGPTPPWTAPVPGLWRLPRTRGCTSTWRDWPWDPLTGTSFSSCPSYTCDYRHKSWCGQRGPGPFPLKKDNCPLLYPYNVNISPEYYYKALLITDVKDFKVWVPPNTAVLSLSGWSNL